MDENEDVIVVVFVEDLDCNLFEVYFVDIVMIFVEVKYVVKWVCRWMWCCYLLFEVLQLFGCGWVEYELYGIVLIIGVWNYLFYLILGLVVGVIVVGNVVVFKLLEIVVVLVYLMIELVYCYFDIEVIVVVQGDGVVSQELIVQGFDCVMFIGGIEIGCKVYEGVVLYLILVIFEFGGKSLVIVVVDVDVDVVVKWIVWIKLFNVGQICVVFDYVLVDVIVCDELVSKIIVVFIKFCFGVLQGMCIVNQC